MTEWRRPAGRRHPSQGRAGRSRRPLGRNAPLARAGDCLFLVGCVDVDCFGRWGSAFQYGGGGKALAMAAVRLVTPSLVKMFSRCFRTVLTETTSWRAISALLCPAASR